jgi:hypothetical protein
MLRALPLLSLLPGLLLSSAAGSEPLDLLDLRPRWIHVAFEISPTDRPGQLDSVYTPEFPAWLEPAERPGEVRVTIPGSAVERHLLVNQQPVAGSFSDFVWRFDAATGQVLSASLSGALLKRIDWGFFSSEVEAQIEIAMDTRGAAGYREPRSLLGERLHDFCAPSDTPDCTLVEPAHLDDRSGYVNAVGVVSARSHGITTTSFCPLGEAIFRELAPAEPSLLALDTP